MSDVDMREFIREYLGPATLAEYDRCQPDERAQLDARCRKMFGYQAYRARLAKEATEQAIAAGFRQSIVYRLYRRLARKP